MRGKAKGLGLSQQAKMQRIFTERVPISYACSETFSLYYLRKDRKGMERERETTDSGFQPRQGDPRNETVT